MRLIPREHPIPPGFEHARFRLRPITIHDVIKDLDAVTSSAERLRERFPWGWPPEEGIGFEEDLIDLAWHQKEGRLRRSFNYAVMSPDEVRLLGCVYVDPPEKQGADVDVSFWVRADEESTGLEAELEAAVRDWIAREWPFQTVRWPGIELSWQEWDALPDA